jgi:hypothetical protein
MQDDLILSGMVKARYLAEGALTQTTLEQDIALLEQDKTADSSNKLNTKERLAIEFRAALKRKLQQRRALIQQQ